MFELVDMCRDLGIFDIILRFAQTHSCLSRIPIVFLVNGSLWMKGWPGTEVPWDLIQLVCPFMDVVFPFCFVSRN